MGIQRNIVAKEKAVYVYDLEQFNNFHSASFKNISTGERITFILYHDYRDDALSINDIKYYIYFLENNITTIIGYNNHDYDDILLKHILLNKEMFINSAKISEIVFSLKKLSDRIINRQRIEKATGKKDKYIQQLKAIKRFSSIDLYLLFNTIDRVSLKQLAINLKWHNIIDLPFTPNHIVVEEEIPKIIIYNDNDVDITEEVLNYKEEDIKFRKQTGILQGVNIINSNDTGVAKKLIAKYYAEATGKKFDDFKNAKTMYSVIELKDCVSPKVKFMTQKYQKLLNIIRNTKVKPFIDEATDTKKKTKKQFEYILESKYLGHTIGLGGIHSNNEAEELISTEDYVYIDADVTAFYPQIIVNENLYPKHLGPEFTKVYKDKIVDMRVAVKKLWQAGIEVEKNKLIDAGAKISANSTFGLTKSIYSWMYDPKMTNYICISGQLFLLMLMERLEELTDCVVVYSNTDGITTKVPKGSVDDYYRICNQWMKHTGFNLEFVNYDRMIMRDVNNYLMVIKDDKKTVKEKGVFVTKKKINQGYNYPIVAKALNQYYTHQVPIDVTIKSEKDVFQFIKAERTSDKKFTIYQWLKDQEDPVKLQKSNRWVVTKGFPEEGVILKYSKTVLNKEGKPETTNMQKGKFLTVVNDITNYKDITKLHIDYDFYITECFKIIKSIKHFNGETHVKKYKQGHLF